MPTGRKKADPPATPALSEARERIDGIDRQIQALIAERAGWAQRVGKAKGPLKERLSGRMFSVEEDARFRDEEDPMGEIDLDALKKEEDVEVDKDTEETEE